MKRSRIVAIALVLAMVLGTVAMAASGKTVTIFPGVNITVNGDKVTPVDANGNEVETFIYNDTTYLPLRYLSELLGWNVDWNGESNTVQLSTDQPVNIPGAVAKDGTYTTEANGRNGKVTVETVISGGKITSVTVTKHQETAGIADGALTLIPTQIVENNSVNVDAVSNATMTSNAIIEAVKAAIVKAGGNVNDFQATPTTGGTPAADGTYTGKAWGRNAEVTVETVISGGKITSVTVIEEEETDGVKVAAMEHIPAWIVEYNSINIDAVCGATMTSTAITSAVLDCILQGGGTASAYSTHGPVIVEKQGPTYECDVVVVGAGASGATAASVAGASGAKVILLEKTATIGGSSNLSSGGTFHNTPLAIEAGTGLTDVETTIADWIVANHYRVDAAVIRQYVTRSGEVPGWVEEHGGPLQASGARYALLDYEEREPAFRNMLNNTITANGGQIITECTAYELVQAADGSITGVKGKMWDGTLIQVNAKAVVMATGGYGANAEMVLESFGFGGVNGGVGQNIGEGLKMVWAVGGKKPINFGGQMLHQTLARATETLKRQGVENMYQIYPMILTYVPSLMNVSPAGYRFRNEETVSSAVSAANTSAFNGPYHLVIVSQSMLETLETEGLPGLNVTKRPGLPPLFYRSFADSEKPYELEALWDGVQEVFDKAIANGHIFKGNTPAELAEAAGMDVDTFVHEFAAYEEACKNGVDPDFGKGADNLLSLGEGPYYAIIAEINDLGSAGGMVINKNFQVLDDNRVAIPGLYAVGSESIGVMYNDTYVGQGVGVGYAFTSGKLGGESAAKYALGK